MIDGCAATRGGAWACVLSLSAVGATVGVYLLGLTSNANCDCVELCANCLHLDWQAKRERGYSKPATLSKLWLLPAGWSTIWVCAFRVGQRHLGKGARHWRGVEF